MRYRTRGRGLLLSLMDELRNTSWIARFGAKRRLGTALVVAAVAFFVQPDSISSHTRSVAYSTVTPATLTTRAQRVISLLTCASSCAGVEPTTW